MPGPSSVAALACLALVSGSGDGERDATKARLRQGEIIVKTSPVKGSKFPRVMAMALIDVAPATLWEVIGDCNTYKENLPNKLLERRGPNVERCLVVVSIPLLPDLSAVTDSVEVVVPDERYTREWKLVKGDYHTNVGKWTLVPFESPTRTLAVYETHVEPKMEVPARVQEMGIRNALPGLFKKLRRRMAERPAPAPPKTP
jgi:hypothetical protein